MRKSKTVLKRNRSLLSQLKCESPAPRINSVWWKLLAPKDRAAVDEVREAFLAGELPGWSKISLYRRLKDELGIAVSITAFRRFFSADKDEG